MIRFLSVFLVCSVLMLPLRPSPSSADGSQAKSPAGAYKKISSFIDDLDLKHLLKLKESVDKKIFKSGEWKEAQLPAGTYQIGTDIPAGHWSLSAAGEYSTPMVWYFEKAEPSGVLIDYTGRWYMQTIVSADVYEENPSFPMSIDINMQDGWFLQFDQSVILSPYTGKNIDFSF